MSPLRIRTTLTSPTLTLPELSQWVGKTVDIIVIERTSPNANGFWNGADLDQLAAEQGIGPIQSVEQLKGDLPDDAFEGFDEAFQSWRLEPWRGEDER